MKENSRKLRDWFLFADRQQHHPVKSASITTHAFIDRRTGNLDEIGSMREDWLISSVFVDADRRQDVQYPADPHAFDIALGWGDGLEFNFAERGCIRSADAYPLILTRTHPITDVFEIELRPDFRWYHFLPQAGGEFRHPLDDIIVATVAIDFHDLYTPTPRVSVHPDYLRDYLAAKRWALVIAVVADRFATRAGVDELEIEPTDEPVRLDDMTMLWPTAAENENGYAWGRSSLYWSAVVMPYDRPRPERSVWHYFGDLPDDGSVAPTFIIDTSGTRGTAEGAGYCFLYFKREVLRKYLDAPGYSIGFHMRNWGVASTPKGCSVDVGVNDEQLVTAFAPDIADLPAHDQAHWASYSVVPSGEVCRELFETRLQQNPPHSPSLPELIRAAIEDLNDAFRAKHGTALYPKAEDQLPARRHISIGPVTENTQEFLDLAKTLYKVAIENMDEQALKNALPPDQRPKPGETLRSIALTERLLIAAGYDQKAMRHLTDRLRALNRLRIAEAHLLSTADLLNDLSEWGATALPCSRRLMWHLAVDTVSGTLHEIASLIREGRH
jgi:hypothetical protein